MGTIWELLVEGIAILIETIAARLPPMTTLTTFTFFNLFALYVLGREVPTTRLVLLWMMGCISTLLWAACTAMLRDSGAPPPSSNS